MTLTSDYTIGIDLGGTRIKMAAVAPSGSILSRWTSTTGDARDDAADDTPDDSQAEPVPGGSNPGRLSWAVTIRREVERMEAAQGIRASAIGLAAPGLAARDSRSIAFMPGRMQGLERLDWTDYLGRPVRVLNDAHGALLGETWQGAAAGLRDVVLITLGTGVGGAILSEGKLMRGHTGRAGHVGHVSLNPEGPPDICGAPASLEDTIGECTLALRTDGRFASTKELVEAAAAGDAFAAAAWSKSVKGLAAAIAGLVNVLDPEAVVIGGGIAQAGPALFEPLAGFLDSMEWRPGGHQVRIVAATLGEYAGALGAARYAKE